MKKIFLVITVLTLYSCKPKQVATASTNQKEEEIQKTDTVAIEKPVDKAKTIRSNFEIRTTDPVAPKQIAPIENKPSGLNSARPRGN